MSAPLVFVATLATIGGCDEFSPTPCDAISVPSVTLAVVDGVTGDPVDDANIRFSIDESEHREAESMGEGTYVLAYEEAGTFEIRITAAGYEPTARTYWVEQSTAGCHVDAVHHRIALDRG